MRLCKEVYGVVYLDRDSVLFGHCYFYTFNPNNNYRRYVNLKESLVDKK